MTGFDSVLSSTADRYRSGKSKEKIQVFRTREDTKQLKNEGRQTMAEEVMMQVDDNNKRIPALKPS